MTIYSLYVGSTPTHDAHSGYRGDVARMLAQLADAPRVKNVWGIWEGETEEVARYDVTLADDATAQRVAYALAILTGNECVMVTRDAGEADTLSTFVSPARYRVAQESRATGNRTLLGNPATRGFTDGPYGFAYVPDVTGRTVAYLVWQDASVTPVS